MGLLLGVPGSEPCLTCAVGSEFQASRLGKGACQSACRRPGGPPEPVWLMAHQLFAVAASVKNSVVCEALGGSRPWSRGNSSLPWAASVSEVLKRRSGKEPPRSQGLGTALGTSIGRTELAGLAQSSP